MALEENPLALIIEDDETLSFVASEALRMASFHPEILRDGQVAQNRLNEVVPAVVVLDLHLPRVSGREILGQIRSDSRLAQTKVFLATADPATAQILRPDADLVLLKPYTFSQLNHLASRYHPRRAMPG
ncbi:MAG: response regulator [Chloroflexota bacterium]